MGGELLRGIAGRLAERWVAALFSPAFAFWAGVAAVWVWATQWDTVADKGLIGAMKSWTSGLGALPALAQAALAVLPLLVIALTGLLFSGLAFPVLRLLEGYWPRPAARLGQRRRRHWRGEAKDGRDRLRTLAAMSSPGPEDSAERAGLERTLRRLPANPDLCMPTRLGNILRAGEARISAHYGLDPIIAWTRLWLVLPDRAREEATTARASLDLAVQAMIGGVLFVPLAFWAWWAAPIGLAVALGAYRGRLLTAAARYADIVESCFDVHRRLLYEALRWPVPASPEKEQSEGVRVSDYLRSGSRAATPVFTSGADDEQS
ncbi:hypothetical protein [Streptomyces sp. T028]|uniref:hypothetical protein n=1 Tax=Streptomyces sp. T028 TaxID=3394379 RepID=UPI003A88D3A5